MPITTVQHGTKKLRLIRIKKHCLGPGGAVLHAGQTVRVPEQDAYTLVNGFQAEFLSEADAARADK